MLDEKQDYWRLVKHIMREDKIMANQNMAISDRVLMIKLERMYPSLLLGERIQVQVWRLAKESGTSRSTATRFLSAMYNGGYFAYNSVLKSALMDGKTEYTRESFVQELEACRHPENIKTREVPKRKQDREKARERIKCRVCGSENMLYKLTLVCRDCNTEQE